MSTSNNTIGDSVKEKMESLKEWLVRYSKIVMPVILVICVLITIVIAVSANKRKTQQEEAVASEETGVSDELSVVPLVPLERDVVPGLNEFMQIYYNAMAEGDTDTLTKIVNRMDAKEILKAVETAKYIESYPTLEVYSKAGPREGTYMVYAYAEMKFYDYDRPVPGLSVFYVCTDAAGDFYINEDGEEEDDELYYMREISLQDDAVDLSNKITVAYNDMMAEEAELGRFILEMKEEIETNVGEALAKAEESGSAVEESGEEAETSGESTETEEEPEEPSVVVTKVKATDVVNIRTSDSETADKLGKAAVGDEFSLLEEKGNGWSKIEYEGKEAFIKSEYLEPSETQTASAQTEEEPEQEEEQEETPAPSTETVTVKENVRIRSSASETSEKLATAYAGDKLKVIMKQADGWTKIDYNGRTAYVKSDYVE